MLKEAYGDGRAKMKNVAFDDMRDDYGDFDDEIYKFSENDLVTDFDRRRFNTGRKDLMTYHKGRNSRVDNDYVNDRAAQNVGISGYQAFIRDQKEKMERYNDSKPNKLAFDEFHSDFQPNRGEIGELALDDIFSNPYDD